MLYGFTVAGTWSIQCSYLVVVVCWLYQLTDVLRTHNSTNPITCLRNPIQFASVEKIASLIMTISETETET